MRDPAMRLGAPHLGGANGIKRSGFFRGVQWNQVYRRDCPRHRPPFVPRLDSASDVRYFDRDFVSQPPTLSEVEDGDGPGDAHYFEGFDYVHCPGGQGGDQI